MNGITRSHSIVRHIIGSVCTWATREQITASEAAMGGEMAYNHMPMAEMAVPKPVRPLTKPPASAPRRTRTI